jgi:ribonuclease Z
LEGIFLTALSPDAIAGVPGMILTAADVGRTSMVLTGPSKTTAFWNSLGYFMRRVGLNVSIREPQLSDSISDRRHVGVDISIDAVPLEAPAASHLCYICHTPTMLGKFDVEKAKELGIPKGPMYGQLKGGASVTLADGRVIAPEQVLGSSEQSKFIAVICDVSSEGAFQGLVSSPAFHRYH